MTKHWGVCLEDARRTRVEVSGADMQDSLCKTHANSWLYLSEGSKLGAYLEGAGPEGAGEAGQLSCEGQQVEVHGQ